MQVQELSLHILQYMAARANIHMHVCNVVPLVRGSLRLAPILIHPSVQCSTGNFTKAIRRPLKVSYFIEPKKNKIKPSAIAF